MKCPCEDCICLPICRYKRFSHLVGECSKVWDYLPQETNHHNNIFSEFWICARKVQATLKSKGFTVEQAGDIQFVRDIK